MATLTETAGPLVRARELARENHLIIAHLYTGTLVIGLGALFGFLQALSRANFIVLPAWFDYYRILTAHGVLMALIFTTFFITGLLTFATYHTIERARSVTLGWCGYGVMLVGFLLALTQIVAGNASVLYTFYAPLKADPRFYIGASLLIVGTWIVAADIFENIAWFKTQNRGKRTPLPAWLAGMTMLMWFLATLGVVAEMGFLIPWSMGLTSGIDVALSRLLFWYFGHPLVYFWIMAAYVIWYTVVPTTIKAPMFSEAITRVAFILLLLFSLPVGVHHQLVDTGISIGWKWLQTMLTFGVAVPSFITAFSIFATFECAARRDQVRGFWNIVRWLPWKDPAFAGPTLGMLLFIPGGFGGLVNASFGMNVLVHNTLWVVGHFHITVGGPVALTFIGASYRLIPALTRRRLFMPKLALAQAYTYFVGMFIMSLSMHWGGLLGAPRRTSEVAYMGASAANVWHPQMVGAAVGGTILAIAILMFVVVATGTFITRQTAQRPEPFEFATTSDEASPIPAIFDNLSRWGLVAAVLAIIAYAGPVSAVISAHAPLAAGMKTW